MKTLVVLLLVVLTSADSASAGEPIDSFRGFPWGTSQESVVSNVNHLFLSYDVESEVTRAETLAYSMFDKGASLTFLFLDEGLHGGIYHPVAGHVSADRNFHTEVIKKLTNKYGVKPICLVNGEVREYDSVLGHTGYVKYEDFIDHPDSMQYRFTWKDQNENIIICQIDRGLFELRYYSSTYVQMILLREDY